MLGAEALVPVRHLQQEVSAHRQPQETHPAAACPREPVPLQGLPPQLLQLLQPTQVNTNRTPHS